MIDAPQTLKEAQAYRYNRRPGNPESNTVAYDESSCAYAVAADWCLRQCFRENGYGPADLYCKQHAKIVHKAIVRLVRREASK